SSCAFLSGAEIIKTAPVSEGSTSVSGFTHGKSHNKLNWHECEEVTNRAIWLILSFRSRVALCATPQTRLFKFVEPEAIWMLLNAVWRFCLIISSTGISDENEKFTSGFHTRNY